MPVRQAAQRNAQTSGVGAQDVGQGVEHDLHNGTDGHDRPAMSSEWRVRPALRRREWRHGLARMLQRKPLMLVAIALANKMARAIWAMVTKREDYRDPARAVAA